MFSLGCIQTLKCNNNTCATGITTHIPSLQKGLVMAEKDRRVAAYAKAVVHEVGTIGHCVGVAEPRQMGRKHIRIVCDDGTSIEISEIHPSVMNASRAEGRMQFEEARKRL
jgi:glutamate synthase domain-containing protein 2